MTCLPVVKCCRLASVKLNSWSLNKIGLSQSYVKHGFFHNYIQEISLSFIHLNIELKLTNVINNDFMKLPYFVIMTQYCHLNAGLLMDRGNARMCMHLCYVRGLKSSDEIIPLTHACILHTCRHTCRQSSTVQICNSFQRSCI